MFNRLNDNISFIFLPRIDSVEIRESEGNTPLEMNFETLADLMTDFEITEEKSEVNAFIPVRFKPESEWVPNKHDNYRIDDNVSEVTMAVIDIDRPGALEKAREAYKDHEYIIHSTHSHTKDTPYKYRMILKLEHPIPVSEWKPFFYKLVMPIEADTSCSNVSRGYYMPSHSSNAGIEPYYEYNPGKALTVEYVENQGRSFEKQLRKANDPDLLNAFLYKISEKPSLEGRRDPFDGRIRKDNITHSRVDCTYEAYFERHKKRIKEHLEQNDNRHNFAMTVIYNEFKLHKEMVDIPSLVTFMYRASQEHSSKAMHFGDTPRELPHLVDSALQRLGTVAKPASEFVSKLRASCQRAKAMSIQVINTGDKSFWKFPEKPKRNKTKEKMLGKSFDEYETAFRDQLRSYAKDKNWPKFAQSVLSSASDLSDHKEVYNLSRFVLKKTDDFYSKVMKRPIQKDKFQTALADFSRRFAGDNESLKKSIMFGFASYQKEMKQLEPKTEKVEHKQSGPNP